MSEEIFAALAGLAGGVLLGLAARLGRFCTLGAIEDALYGKEWLRMRMWAFAIAISIASTFLMADLGLIALDKTIYLTQSWNPLAGVVGGLMFGYGMAMAGSCGFGALARLGGGDMRYFVLSLVIAISAAMAVGGPTAYLRVLLFPTEVTNVGSTGIAHALAQRLELSELTIALFIAGAIGLFAVSNKEFRQSPKAIIASLAVALAIVLGWVATSYLFEESFEEVSVASHSFTVPVGDTLMYLMTASGGGLSFAVGSVFGVLSGAFLGSLLKGHFRWEACDDPRELRRQILGGFLMGTGGVIALGCTIGQCISAFSTLAVSAPVVMLSIIAGAAIGLRQLVVGFQFAFWKQ
ncbi:putative inner membrane protein [Pseudovibrio sp. Ad13]|uniref:YeeE/YedE family protein n=1 Tax=Pseudovibrio sp. Ad13 TaxID=989396 RepID=UPI0007AE439E|nr:YeeE/YedE family protein [Pseudovibrio sp. Ad13]KZK84986.1 putative inner membrane protein [Pseudovibrio sp. Ad13]